LFVSAELPTQLKIVPQQLHRFGAGEVEAEESIHGALLNLRAGFPAGVGRLAHAEQIGELLLRQSQVFAALADVLRREELCSASEGGTYRRSTR